MSGYQIENRRRRRNMAEFAQSDNFMKLVYLTIGIAFITVGFVNKQEVIDLYKFTLGVCS